MATENDAQQAHPGVVVIDVSDPTNPQPTAYLADTPAALNPHENIKVNQARGLLGLAQSNGPNFTVYEPVRRLRAPQTGVQHHGAQ